MWRVQLTGNPVRSRGIEWIPVHRDLARPGAFAAFEQAALDPVGGVSDAGKEHPQLAAGTARPLDGQKAGKGGG